ncbi:MAG: MFS transporter [Desulfobacterales bacterium]|jgi:MFS family permease
MAHTLFSFVALYAAVFIFVTGVGLLGTFLSLRMSLEGFSEQVTGMVMSGYYVGTVLGCFYCYRVICRVGHIRAFATFAAVCTASVMMHGLFISPVSWTGLRLLTGIAVTGLYMVVESWLNAGADPSSRGRIFSIYMVVSFSGMGAGQFLLNTGQVNGPHLFLVTGVLLALCLVPVSTTHSVQPQVPKTLHFNLMSLWRTAPMGMLGCLAAGLINGALYTLGPVFGHLIGLTVSGISVFMGVTVLSGLILQWPVGLLSDRFDRNIVMAGLGLAVAAISLAITLLMRESFPLLLMLTILYGGVAFTLYPVAVAHTHDFFPPDDIVAVSSALILSFGVGASLGPPAAAMMMKFFGPSGLYVFIALSGSIFGGIVAVYRRRRPERLEAEYPVAFKAMRTSSPVVAVLDPRSEPQTTPDGSSVPDACN